MAQNPLSHYTTLHRAGYSPGVWGINTAEMFKLYYCRAITPDVGPCFNKVLEIYQLMQNPKADIELRNYLSIKYRVHGLDVSY